MNALQAALTRQFAPRLTAARSLAERLAREPATVLVDGSLPEGVARVERAPALADWFGQDVQFFTAPELGKKYFVGRRGRSIPEMGVIDTAVFKRTRNGGHTVVATARALVD